jgi:hypothetical protein
MSNVLSEKKNRSQFLVKIWKIDFPILPFFI